MKKTIALLAALFLLLTAASALADEVELNAEVVPSGPAVTSVTIRSDLIKPTTTAAKFTFEQTVTRGRGPEATTEIVSKPVYSAFWQADGAVTLTVDSFSPNAVFTITYAIPAKEDQPAEVIGTWTNEQVTSVHYAVVDDFITDTYTGTYQDAEGKDVEVKIVYRLYVPAKTEGAALVVTMHGSGESGDNGVAHVTSNQISSCWADPAWQAEHPCYVFAPQWPNSDVSNDLELRDSYLAIYHDMIEEIVAKYQPSKTYLATLSMGSRLGFRYLTLYPEAFDAALMCCGAMQNADLSGVTNKPIWLVHAVSDFVNASQNSVDAYNQLMAAGNPNVKLTLITDEGMNGVFSHAVWQYVFGNPQYMNWLFAQ